MQAKPTARRGYGSGSLLIKSGNYYGKWRIDNRQVKRKLGPVRQPGRRDGLTRTMAEAKLRSLMPRSRGRRWRTGFRWRRRA